MTLIESLEKFGEAIVKDSKIFLKQKKKISSGELYRSLNYSVKNDKLEVYMAQHGVYVNDGRKKGEYVPVDDLKDWMESKNIPLKYSFPINKKIKEKGIKATHFFDKAYEKNEKQFEKDLEKSVDDALDKLEF